MNTKPIIQIKFHEGRMLVLEWPYNGPDKIFFPVVLSRTRPCKIHGYAKPHLKEGIYAPEVLNELINEDGY